MNICVCIKQVPDTDKIKIDPVKHTLIRTGVPSIVNPYDSQALELAARLKESFGGFVAAVSMGPAQAEKALRTCLEVGADRAFLVSDRAFGGSDTLATGYILSRAILAIEKKLGISFDLIVCGMQAADGDTAQVGPQIAEQLGLPQVTCVTQAEGFAMELSDQNNETEGSNGLKSGTEASVCNGSDVISEAFVYNVSDVISQASVCKALRVTAETEGGTRSIGLKLPGLITVSKTPFEPRYATYSSYRRARSSGIDVLNAESLILEAGLDLSLCGLSGSPTRVTGTCTPVNEKKGVRLSKSPSEMAEELAEFLELQGFISPLK